MVQEISLGNQSSKVSLEEIEKLIESMDVYKSALGNVSMTMSPNGLDTECYIINEKGIIRRHNTILWEDIAYFPSARQYLHLYECYPELDFLSAWKYRIDETNEL